jgi:hypothetical protein
MNVETGAEAALFPEKEYVSGIFVAVQARAQLSHAEAQNASAPPGRPSGKASAPAENSFSSDERRDNPSSAHWARPLADL